MKEAEEETSAEWQESWECNEDASVSTGQLSLTCSCSAVGVQVEQNDSLHAPLVHRVIFTPSTFAATHQPLWSRESRNQAAALLKSDPRISSPSGPTLPPSSPVSSSCRRRSPPSYPPPPLTGTRPPTFTSPCASWCCAAQRRWLLP